MKEDKNVHAHQFNKVLRVLATADWQENELKKHPAGKGKIEIVSVLIA